MFKKPIAASILPRRRRPRRRCLASKALNRERAIINLARLRLNLTGHTALVTGGGSGIGLAIAETLLARGNAVVICGRDRGRLASAKARLPALETAECDVTDPASVARLAHVHAARTSILVNNAGVSAPFDFLAPVPAGGDHFFEIDVNLVGALRMIRAFLPALAANPEAAIVNVTTGLAFVPLAERPLYSASKAGLHVLTRTLRRQLRKTGVEVFELLPPVTDTPMTAAEHGLHKTSPERVAEALLTGMAAGRSEIAIGIGKGAKWLNRIIPELAFNELNKFAEQRNKAK